MKPDKYTKEEAIKLYDSFDSMYNRRVEAFDFILKPYFEVVNDYGRLFSRIHYITGFIKPKNEIDTIQRDLSSDAFDFLNETKYLIKRGQFNITYPIARRAFESITLMVAFNLKNELAIKWKGGGEIPNKDVRNVLDNFKEIGGESRESMKSLYDFFSKKSHPNYAAIPHGLIGLGNYYAIGPIPEPLLLLIVDLCIEIIDLWFWLIAFMWYYNLDNVSTYDPSFKNYYLVKKHKVLEVRNWLFEQRLSLIEELKIQIDK
jgi:hypothetical protein